MVATTKGPKPDRVRAGCGATDGAQFVTHHRGARILDRESRRVLGMSGAEFVRRYRAGETADLVRSDVARLAVLIPLAER